MDTTIGISNTPFPFDRNVGACALACMTIGQTTECKPQEIVTYWQIAESDPLHPSYDTPSFVSRQLVIEIEDGTSVLRVRLSEPITRRLFGVDAREFKKIFQADPDRAIGIQVKLDHRARRGEGNAHFANAPKCLLS